MFDHEVWKSSRTCGHKNEIWEKLKTFRVIVTDVLHIIRYVLSKNPGFEHLQSDAPRTAELRKWANVDISSLFQYCDNKEQYMQQFKTDFIDELTKSVEEVDTKTYEGVKSVIGQIEQGAFGGMSQATVDGIMKHLPRDGLISQILAAFFQVVGCTFLVSYRL